MDQSFTAARLVVSLLAAAALSAFADTPASPSQRSTPEVLSSYSLQPDDEVVIRSLASKEITDKTFRVDQNGEVNLPLVGVTQLGGTRAGIGVRLFLRGGDGFFPGEQKRGEAVSGHRPG